MHFRLENIGIECVLSNVVATIANDRDSDVWSRWQNKQKLDYRAGEGDTRETKRETRENV